MSLDAALAEVLADGLPRTLDEIAWHPPVIAALKQYLHDQLSRSPHISQPSEGLFQLAKVHLPRLFPVVFLRRIKCHKLHHYIVQHA
jgi:hypothetical protein